MVAEQRGKAKERMTCNIPRIVVAGTGSGVGKTTVTLGLARALDRRGLDVQPFKAGPDYLDPTYLTRAAGRECYNLDTWMMGEDYVRRLCARGAADADIALVEGVMGMFDGWSVESSRGSTAHLARHLRAPVLLIVNAHGAARSLGATVKGFAEFDRSVEIAGVLANHCGSEGHVDMLRRMLGGTDLPPLLGGLLRDAMPELQHRHLGLVTADEDILDPDALDDMADALESCVDVDSIIQAARETEPLAAPATDEESATDEVARVGIARDRAFHFYYPDNLEALERAGCRLVSFSPVEDEELPRGLDALYLGGGYPEECAGELSRNKLMLSEVRDFCESGRPVYAECGGLMYLSRAVRDRDGNRFAMAGVLPVETRMLDDLRSLGYVEVEFRVDTAWGAAGNTIRGHEFHYSEMSADPAEHEGWEQVYEATSARGTSRDSAGYQRGNVLASYVHLHFASCPDAASYFASFCSDTGKTI